MISVQSSQRSYGESLPAAVVLNRPTFPAFGGRGLRLGEEVGFRTEPTCPDYGGCVIFTPGLRGARCRIPR
jgi:hypothetical protein